MSALSDPSTSVMKPLLLEPWTTDSEPPATPLRLSAVSSSQQQSLFDSLPVFPSLPIVVRSIDLGLKQPLAASSQGMLSTLLHVAC